MNISLYSVFISFVWSSLFILLLCCCRRWTRGWFAQGVWPMLLIVVCTVIRLILPVEIVPFTRVLSIEGLFTQADSFLRTPVCGQWLTPGLIFGGIWLTGALVQLLRFLVPYFRFRALVRKFEPVDAEDKLYQLAATEAGQNSIKKFSIYMTSLLSAPILFGFFSPVILLPLYPYSEEDYTFIFQHELAHYLNHDIWSKLLVELLLVAFWWNPLVYLLKKDLDQALEFRCDQEVVQHMDMDRRVDYVETLKKTLQFSCEAQGSGISNLTVAEFSDKNEELMLRRLDAILYHRPNRRAALASVGMALIMCGCMVLSYLFVPQPYYQPPREEIEERIGEGNYVGGTTDNLYLIDNGDGTYSAIYNGEVQAVITEESAAFLKDHGYTVKPHP